jgi:hypothetical protein
MKKLAGILGTVLGGGLLGFGIFNLCKKDKNYGEVDAEEYAEFEEVDDDESDSE